MDNNSTSADDIGYLCQLRDILRFLAQKALEYIRWCMRWFLGLFSATTVLVMCTHLETQLCSCCCGGGGSGVPRQCVPLEAF